eukprot:SAG22_NODE_566_length_9044_cov_4.581107_4_plen_168_part_00
MLAQTAASIADRAADGARPSPKDLGVILQSLCQRTHEFAAAGEADVGIVFDALETVGWDSQTNGPCGSIPPTVAAILSVVNASCGYIAASRQLGSSPPGKVDYGVETKFLDSQQDVHYLRGTNSSTQQKLEVVSGCALTMSCQEDSAEIPYLEIVGSAKERENCRSD